MPTPRRLLDALVFPRAPVMRGAEPVLRLDSLPPLKSSAHPPLPGRRAIERELEEGSRRVYVPMQEAEVLEPTRRR
ncbi:MAG: hypothetical protein EOP39_10675 [Rubrivivax sp.]|nr:MAG: hypothetical protein EOP39_10675 [Rubrivivax sp.]